MRLSPVMLHSSDMQWTIKRITEQPFAGYYHWHSCCELLLVHQGQGSVIVNQQRYEMEQGMLFLFRPFELHRVHAQITPEHPYVRSIIYVDPNRLEQKLRDFPLLRRFVTKLFQIQNGQSSFSLSAYLPMIDSLFAMLLRNSTPFSTLQHEEDAWLCLVQLLRMVQAADQDHEGDTCDRSIQRIKKDSERIMKWMEEHYQEPFDLGVLAKEIHLSKSHLSRVFKQETGSSISSYLLARRLKEACRLLEASECSVEEITRRVGLTNASYFIQTFKKHIGVTPLQYRKQGGR